MANTLLSFDSEHQGIVVSKRKKLNNYFFSSQQHDAKYDYYGKRIATAGSDGKINIFEIINQSQKKVAELSK